MYTFVDFTSQIVGQRGVPCPTNKEVSYTNLMCWLDRDLKNKLLYYYYKKIIRVEISKFIMTIKWFLLFFLLYL
jgi:hypothetical protein